MDRGRKVPRTLMVLAAVGGLATLGAFSAFTSQANNPDNRVSAGTVTLADNDGGVALYDFTDAKPGDSERLVFVVPKRALAGLVRRVRIAGRGWGIVTLTARNRAGQRSVSEKRARLAVPRPARRARR